MSLALLAVPVQPDGDEARRWLLDELAKQPYQASKPTPVDLAAQAFFDWLGSLFRSQGDPTPTVLLVVALTVVVALVVIAVLLFGIPRANRRSRGAGAGLFGEDDRRTAAELRAAARAAAAAGDFSLAVLERYRALARDLHERTLVEVFPGTTAHAFAREAAGVFPDEATELAHAADAFDGIRYAGRSGARDQAERVAALDDRLVAARPRLPEPVA
jgi:Domain of unknown function (DUF4129)